MTLGLFQGIGHWELLIILAIGLLLFGRRLPEVGRSLGQGIVQFKKGLKDIGDDIDESVDQESKRSATAGRKAELSEKERANVVLDAPRDAEGRDVRVSRADAVE